MRPGLIAGAWKALVQVRRLSRRSYSYRAMNYLRHAWNERMTLPGKYVVAAGITTGIAGSAPDAMAGAAAFSAFVALLLLASAASMLRRLRVGVSHTAPPRCVAGSVIPLRVSVHNNGKRDLADIGAAEFRLPEHLAADAALQYVGRLPAGATHTFHYSLTAARRGVYTLPGPTAVSAFPFGLMHAKRFTPQPRSLLVYPAFHTLTRLDIPTSDRYQPGGIVLTSHVGESMEFIGNREYQPGDRIRDLHSRSWARVGYPVVRQYQEEFLTRVALIVDTHSPEPNPWRRLDGEGTRALWLRRLRIAWGVEPEPVDPVLEANLSLAAAISDHLARQEYILDLFAAGPELYHFQAGRSLAYLDDILDILACIQRCPSDPFDVIAPRIQGELAQVSTLIALFLDWDDRRREFVQRVLAAGVQVKVLVVSEKFGTGQIDGPAGAIQCFTPRQVRAGIEGL